MDYSKFINIDTFIFDVDGVFTNSSLFITDAGEMLRSVSTRDGEGIKQALLANYNIFIITGGNSIGVRKRFEYLNITGYYDDVSDKLKILETLLKKYHLSNNKILYMGDDLADIGILREVAISSCPKDAAPDVLSVCNFISPYNGGEGCIRDIIETTMRIQNTWPIL